MDSAKQADLKKIGKYQIRGVLGRGAMGTVYEGWDEVIARRVAIKTLRLPETGDTEAEAELGRFQREAQAAGRLNHPNIVGLFDISEADGLAYLVMEFVDGRTLKSMLDAGERFDLAEIARLMGELLAGLRYSHERGVVHRDVKPANLILTSTGTLKIADFGIARIESSTLTQAGTVMGTPAYMSPEQFMGQTVDARTDIYSSGVLLYQLLTGERPFEGGMTAIMHKALNTIPPAPSELSVTAPARMDAVVARAMAKRPEERFATAQDFADAIGAAFVAGAAGAATVAAADSADATVIQPAPPPRPSAPPPAPPPPASSRMPLLAGTALAVALLAGGGIWYVTQRSSPPVVVAPTASPTPTPAPPAPVIAPNPTPTPPPVVIAPTPTPAPEPAPAPSQAVIVPSPTPTPAAPIAPAPEAHPPLSPAALTATLAAALDNVPCALTAGDVRPDGTADITGLTSHGDGEAALRTAAAAAAPDARIDWRISTVRRAYCPALDLLAPIAARFGVPDSGSGLTVGLAGERKHLRDGQQIIVDLRAPDFASYSRVDYFQSDGSVFHLYPTNQSDRDAIIAPDTTRTLGEPRGGFAGWQVGTPYGTDVIMSVASSLPLFAHARPQSESAATYLRDLRAAIDRVRAHGGRLAGGAVTLETSAR